jgi:hypothetical protein
MYQTFQQKKKYKKYLSPFDALLENPYDEEAWQELFSYRLDMNVCHVVITEYGVIRLITWKNGYRREITCTRKGIAYC